MGLEAKLITDVIGSMAERVMLSKQKGVDEKLTLSFEVSQVKDVKDEDYQTVITLKNSATGVVKTVIVRHIDNVSSGIKSLLESMDSANG